MVAVRGKEWVLHAAFVKKKKKKHKSKKAWGSGELTSAGKEQRRYPKAT